LIQKVVGIELLLQKRKRYEINKAIHLDRYRAELSAKLNPIEVEAYNTVFGQMYKKSLKLTKMWRGGHSNPFEVYLLNEGAEDAGGPRRDTIDQICKELMDDKLIALLCKTANDEAGLYELGGEGRKLNPQF